MEDFVTVRRWLVLLATVHWYGVFSFVACCGMGLLTENNKLDGVKPLVLQAYFGFGTELVAVDRHPGHAP
jgi:hypothetical protein